MDMDMGKSMQVIYLEDSIVAELQKTIHKYRHTRVSSSLS